MIDTTEKEVWKPIPSLYGIYEASSLGRIRRAVPGRRTQAGKVLKLQLRGRTNKYKIFTPTTGHRSTLQTMAVGVAVLEAFVGPRPSPSHEMHHLNRDTFDDRPENLAWIHWRENRPGRYPEKDAA